ncbi:MAG: hypothetical protein JXQ65_12000 [Candidatus Marinimicrobia bacterium]|nr:hypothetical protein [Candidatus Neomarinimicrobiota bacterium]
MFKKLVLTVLILSLMPAIIMAQHFDLQSFKNTTMDSRQFMYSMQQKNNDDVWIEDSVAYEYEKSPGKAFLMSAIIPGAGEFYTGHWGRTIGFLSMEALFWTMYFVKNAEGEDIEDEYLKYADNHWDMNNWIVGTASNEGCKLDGSHHLYAILKTWDSDKGEYIAVEGTEFRIDDNYQWKVDSLNILYGSVNYIIDPIKNRDYYENIGKYDQFSCGWDDFENDSTTSKNRKHYINRREDSNNALKAAGQFGTAVIINHIVSAIHAQILAKNYKSDEQAMKWGVELMTDYREKYLVNGLNFSLRF